MRYVKGPLVQRFWAKVDKRGDDECWPWTAGCTTAGYGSIGSGGAGTPNLYAHRISYEFAHGTIPEGLHVLHSCDNPPCCNPAHLFLGTQVENMADMCAKGRNVPPRAPPNNKHAAKLTKAQVAEIRQASGTYRAIAARFGISRSNVGFIKTGKSWREEAPQL